MDYYKLWLSDKQIPYDPIGLDEDGNDGDSSIPIIPYPDLDDEYRPIGKPWNAKNCLSNPTGKAMHYNKEIIIENQLTGYMQAMTNMEFKQWLNDNKNTKNYAPVIRQLL